MRSSCFFAVSVIGALALPACVASQPAASPAAAPSPVALEQRFVTPETVLTERELRRSAETAMGDSRWMDAIRAYRTLLEANATAPAAPKYAFNIALAYEAQGERTLARDCFAATAEKYPESDLVRPALVHTATLDAYLEAWTELAAVATKLLARVDADDVDRMLALGARGLALVEQGQDAAGSKDIHEGLKIADRTHYLATDVLPVAVAQLRFGLGELRRIRSEKITFDPLPEDFLARLEERATGLLDAQAAYVSVVKSIDPHWATMAGYRLGDMYRVLHHELVAIAPPVKKQDQHDRDYFYGMMHVRYRTLLQKGMRQIDDTLKFGERTQDESVWMIRARAARSDMQAALDEENAQLSKLPYTEADITAAIAEMEKAAAEKGARAAKH